MSTWVALEKHPNIVQCFWMETLDNLPFMALEWVVGEEGRTIDLRGWLRCGTLDLPPARNDLLAGCMARRPDDGVTTFFREKLR